jgi:hypothetical protein
MPLPSRGGALFDARHSDRSCRISWHPDKGIFSISIWQEATCLATFHLTQDQVPEFISDFVRPLAQTNGIAAEDSAAG